MFSFFKKLKAVRGAVFTANDANIIRQDSVFLYTSIIEKNYIKECDIVSVQFSLTFDLDAFNPCTALREAGYAQSVALFTSLEPFIKGSQKSVVRVIILYYGRKKPEYVYLNGAQVLRL